jgi:hypothetical protein
LILPKADASGNAARVIFPKSLLVNMDHTPFNREYHRTFEEAAI